MLPTIEKLQLLSPLKGYNLKVTFDVVGDYIEYTFRCRGIVDSTKGLSKIVKLTVPQPDEDGVYELDGVARCIMSIAKPGEGSKLKPGDVKEWLICDVNTILTGVIQQALEMALDTLGTEDRAQMEIDSFFRTSPNVLSVDPDKPLDKAFASNTIRVDFDGQQINKDWTDFRAGVPENFCGRIDLLTSPNGESIGHVYRIAQGAVIQDGKIIPGKEDSSVFNKELRSILLFPENTRPYRLQLLRSSLSSHESLVHYEDPMIRHEDYVPGTLRGSHFLTAIMADRWNWSDGITVSKSAAMKLECIRRKRLSTVDFNQFFLEKSIGDTVLCGEPIAIVGESYFRSTWRLTSTITDIIQSTTILAGRKANKLSVRLMGQMPAENGSKIMNRHGSKGVIIIVDDIEMPITEDGRRIEIMVHPRSVFARRSFGMLREMGISNLIQSKSLTPPVECGHFDNELPTIEELAKTPAGEKVTLYKKRGKQKATPYEEKTFVGLCYWMRLDKHPFDIISSTASEKPINAAGRNPNSGKQSGQKINVAMMSSLLAKDMPDIVKSLAHENVEPSAISLLDALLYSGEVSDKE